MNDATDRWKTCGVLIGWGLLGLLLIGCLLRSSAIGQEADSNDYFEDVVEDVFEETIVVEAANVVVAGIAGNPDAQAGALKQHFTQALRPLLLRELDFIRAVCPPAQEQRWKVKAAGEAALEQVVEQAVRTNAAQRVVQVRMRAQQNSKKAEPTPRQRIQEALTTTLKEVVSAEDCARYQDEVSKRTAREKRSAILLLVARLDSVLFLTAEQREKICDSLDSNWQEKWQSWLNFDQMPSGYMPMIADDLLAPHLTKNQKLVWGQQEKIEIDVSDQMEANPDNVTGLDDWWGGPR